MARWKVQSDYARHDCEVSVKVGDLVRLTAFKKTTGLHGALCLVLRARDWYGKDVVDVFCYEVYEEIPIEAKHAEVISESR